ncbi:MAG: hypothetical protein EOM76_03865 [Sphingobacteriia bacterium]|nr:hypothetical protein [Sphingobacteriia bacterium]
MKKHLFLLLLLAITGGVVCAQRQYHITQSQTRLVESQSGVVTAPIIGELDQISPIKMVDSLEFDISHFRKAQEIIPLLNDYKRYVIASYCSKNNYDLIINPLFQITTNTSGDKLKVIVTGFPARYKSFRPATANDTWMISFMNDVTTDDRAKQTLKNY